MAVATAIILSLAVHVVPAYTDHIEENTKFNIRKFARRYLYMHFKQW